MRLGRPATAAQAARRRHLAGPGRSAWPAFDVLLFVGVALVAARLRLQGLEQTAILADQVSHLRSAAEIAADVPVVQPPFFYTSLYLLLMAGFSMVLADPVALVTAWSVCGAAAAGLTAVALRRLAGPVAAVAGGLLLAAHPADMAVQVGIKSPYFITVFSALAALGLAGTVQRRPWGPLLLIFGGGVCTAMHIGLWPLGVGCATVGAVAAVLQGPPRGLRLFLAAAPTAAVAGWLWLWDGQRMLEELAFFRRMGPPPAMAERSFQTSLDMALAMPQDAQRLCLAVWGTGLVAGVGWLWLGRTPAARWWSTASHRAAAVGALIVGGLLAIAPLHFIRVAEQTNYSEPHHLVALLPLVAVALSWAGSALLPARPLPLHWLGGAVFLVPWALPVLQGRIEVQPFTAPRATSLLTIAHHAREIRQDALDTGSRPAIVGLSARQQSVHMLSWVGVMDALAVVELPMDAPVRRCWTVRYGATGDWKSAKELIVERAEDCATAAGEVAALCTAADPDAVPVRGMSLGGLDHTGSAAWFPCARDH